MNDALELFDKIFFEFCFYSILFVRAVIHKICIKLNCIIYRSSKSILNIILIAARVIGNANLMQTQKKTHCKCLLHMSVNSTKNKNN